MKTEAIAYLRVSGRAQIKGHGFDRQRQTITQYAKSAKYTLINEYKESFTGTESDRPQFNRAIEELLSNGCRTIIIESLDRLARDLSIQLQLVAYLASKGLTLISASTEQDVTAAMAADPMQKAMIQVQGVFAELEKSLLVRKLYRAREAKRVDEGRCEGKKPFGYYPGETETLQVIKKLRRKKPGQKQLSFKKIVDILNADKYSTRHGGKWRVSSVRSVLISNRKR